MKWIWHYIIWRPKILQFDWLNPGLTFINISSNVWKCEKFKNILSLVLCFLECDSSDILHQGGWASTLPCVTTCLENRYVQAPVYLEAKTLTTWLGHGRRSDRKRSKIEPLAFSNLGFPQTRLEYFKAVCKVIECPGTGIPHFIWRRYISDDTLEIGTSRQVFCRLEWIALCDWTSILIDCYAEKCANYTRKCSSMEAL